MKKIGCLFLAFFFMSLSQAFADYYTFQYVDGTFSASGTLQTAPATDGSGYLSVTQGTLSAAGLTATLYNLAGTLPIGSSTYSPSGAFLYDNRLSPSSTDSVLSSGGLLFKAILADGSSGEVNIWGNGGANNYSLYLGMSAGNYPLQYNGGAFTLSKTCPVPVPPAALLLGCGLFGLVGLRKRLKK